LTIKGGRSSRKRVQSVWIVLLKPKKKRLKKSSMQKSKPIKVGDLVKMRLAFPFPNSQPGIVVELVKKTLIGKPNCEYKVAIVRWPNKSQHENVQISQLENLSGRVNITE
jgi:hypothetical protein